jgi:hypothetical protein
MKKGLILVTLAALALFMATATLSAATAVGAEKCKMCHKVQYESWAASKHAAQSPKVDCESCHGPGSDYMKISVMKDPAAAKAAGLILPTKADCGKCHGKGKVPAITDETFAKVHEHKAK